MRNRVENRGQTGLSTRPKSGLGTDSSVPGLEIVSNLARRLTLQQRAFALLAPAIAAVRTVAAHNTMARDRDSHGIRRAGSSHCAYGPRLADRRRHFAVRLGAAGRNLAQMVPDLPLKGRRPNIQ